MARKSKVGRRLKRITKIGDGKNNRDKRREVPVAKSAWCGGKVRDEGIDSMTVAAKKRRAERAMRRQLDTTGWRDQYSMRECVGGDARAKVKAKQSTRYIKVTGQGEGMQRRGARVKESNVDALSEGAPS